MSSALGCLAVLAVIGPAAALLLILVACTIVLQANMALRLRLRGRDSNPNFLIQSQASYH